MPYKDPEQQRAYQNEWMRRRRREWIETNGPCVDCSSWESPEVDHADSGSKVTHRVWSWAKKRREAELAKCVVRCGPCHQKKSNGEKARGEQSGAAKITEETVRLIRQSPLSQRKLGAQLGIDPSLVWQIRARRVWRHVA